MVKEIQGIIAVSMSLLMVGCTNEPQGDSGQADFDEDGFVAAEDCDDHDTTIFPQADEVLNDGIDQDCDGLDATCTVNLTGVWDTHFEDDGVYFTDDGSTITFQTPEEETRDGTEQWSGEFVPATDGVHDYDGTMYYSGPQYIGSIVAQCENIPTPTLLIVVDTCTLDVEVGDYSGFNCGQDPCCYNTDPDQITWYTHTWIKLEE